MEALGSTSPQAGANSFVAFLAMQDIYAENDRTDLEKDVYATLVADWWRQSMVANVATVNRGFSGAQYVRLADNSWLPPIGSPGVLTQTGLRVKTRDACLIFNGSNPGWPYATARRWDHSGVTFSLRSAGGDVLSVAPWKWNYGDENNCEITYGYQPTQWTFPQGPAITFTYDYQQGVTGVTTTLGRSITFTGPPGYFALNASLGGLTAGQQMVGSGQITGIADAAGDLYKFDYFSPIARTATQRPVPYQLLQHVYEPVNGSTPALEYSYDTRGLVEQAKDADALQLGTHGPYNWFIAEGGRGERDDPAGGAYTVYYSTDGDEVRNIDELSREVDSAFDGRHRVTQRTFPELDQELFGYDTNDNVISLTKVPKPCPTPPNGCVTPSNIVVSATYEPTWNKIATVTDARGNTTNFSYLAAGNNGASMLQQVLRPAVGGVRPTYTFTYNANGLTTQSVDPAGYTVTHAYDSSGNLTSTTDGAAAVGSNPALNLTTAYTPDSVGNVVTTLDPKGNATTAQFDAMRRKTDEQERNGGASATAMAVSHFVFDANSRTITEEHASALDSSGNPTAWAITTTAYTPTGKVAQVTDPVGNITQTSYDALDRTQCVAVRMNPSVYNALPASACSLGTAGTYGSDRISELTYDLAGEKLSEIHALGDPLQENYAAWAYGNDSEQLSVQDAVGNKTVYTYDGFNRLTQTKFPSKTRGAGTSDAADFETYTYDANGNRLTLTKRDGATVLSWCYDALDRETDKYLHALIGGCGTTPPAPTGNDVATTYDLAGRRVSSVFGSGLAVTYGLDSAGRVTSEATGTRTLTFAYDSAGNRTRETWPDTFYVTYGYDALNRMTSITDVNSVSLATFGYDSLSRRTSLTYGDTSSSAYGYDLDGHLTSLAFSFPGQTSANQSYTFSYNPAGQDLASNFTNALYKWTNHPFGTTAKTYDGLNRDAAIAAIGTQLSCGGSGGYDCNGNLTNNGSSNFTYDPENRLISATQGSTILDTLAYDPLGRLNQTTTQSATTQFLYDSSDLDAEYSNSGVLLHRYVHGPRIDEPIGWYNLVSGPTLNYLHADRQGSVVATSNSSGVTEYPYGPYGEPQTWGGSRFSYTGQIMLPEVQLYHYKARAYDPAAGRFMQVDPAGYKDDVDLYSYARGDPVDGKDPTGAVVVIDPATAPQMIKEVNSESSKKFQADEKGVVTRVKGPDGGPVPSGAAHGSDRYAEDLYRDTMSQGTIRIKQSSTYEHMDPKTGKLEKTSVDSVGGGVTQIHRNVKPGTNDADITVSGNSNENLKGTNGQRIPDTPADILMHEIVGHATAIVTGEGGKTGDAIDDENAVRKERGEPARGPDPFPAHGHPELPE